MRVCVCVCAYMCVYVSSTCVCVCLTRLHYSNTRNRGSTDESLDEDEESLLEVEDVTAYLRFNKEVCK